ncbi:MAG: hypothetical protein IPJ49_19440 [Candidatus Obscuribacter sp.]|nr:hypothetical protein [Candidatus Obscuribacter sp.]
MTDSAKAQAMTSSSHFAPSKKAPPEPKPSPLPPDASPALVELYQLLEELLEIILKMSGRKSWGPPYTYIGKEIDWSRENKKRCLWCSLALFICIEIAWALEMDREGKRPLVTPPAMQHLRPPDLV